MRPGYVRYAEANRVKYLLVGDLVGDFPLPGTCRCLR